MFILTILLFLLGVVLATVLLLILSVFAKDTFAHDPANPRKITWMVKVPANRSVVIQKGGRPLYVLRGDEDPIPSDVFLWDWYKSFVMRITGYHTYVPFFTGPTVYDLPRYRVKEEGGRKVYVVVDESDPGYRSNHVRTELTTWYFEYSGAEIQKMNFTIKGSVQIRITRGKEVNVLYKTDSWNTLLDQALNSVIRAVVRRDMTLDMVIGKTSNKLRDDSPSSDDPYGQVAKLIMQHLKEYEIDGIKLDDLGIEIERADIIDFEDELTKEQREKLLAAVLGKEEAHAIALKGEAEAEAIMSTGTAEAQVIALKGEATATAQGKLAQTHSKNPEIAAQIIQADALRAFAEKGGILDAAVAAFIKTKGDKK